MVSRVIGDRLREHAKYRDMLEPKTRCWRLNYAGEFHMDITPSVPNPACRRGGELVPDRILSDWKPTNPKGYKQLFEERAALRPQLRLTKSATLVERSDNVEDFPAPMAAKGVLRRAVQVAKRHRDHYFAKRPALAPISVIITTLASRSYEACVRQRTYDHEFDLLADVLRRLTDFFDRTPTAHGVGIWVVENETTGNENFAEKWNNDPALPQAFFEWHQHAVAYFDQWCNLQGNDRLIKSMSEAFGDLPVKLAFDAINAKVATDQLGSRLVVAPNYGLTSSVYAGTTVQPHTFFGAK
jgi:hypothetical protein